MPLLLPRPPPAPELPASAKLLALVPVPVPLPTFVGPSPALSCASCQPKSSHPPPPAPAGFGAPFRSLRVSSTGAKGTFLTVVLLRLRSAKGLPAAAWSAPKRLRRDPWDGVAARVEKAPRAWWLSGSTICTSRDCSIGLDRNDGSMLPLPLLLLLGEGENAMPAAGDRQSRVYRGVGEAMLPSRSRPHTPSG